MNNVEETLGNTEYTPGDHAKYEFTQYDRATLNEEVETLLGFAAGDAYEGWQDYWVDQEVYEREMMDTLERWRIHCVTKSDEA